MTFVSGGFSNGWTNVVAEAPSEDPIFRSLSLIDRGGANLLVGTVIELGFPVPVVNRVGIPVDDEGVHVAVTLTGPSDFTLVMTPLDGTPSVAFSDTLANTPIEALRFSFQGSGDPAEQRSWFNAISVPEPAGAGAATAIGALAWLAGRRRVHSSQRGGVGGPKAL